jgi:hypothetical protein
VILDDIKITSGRRSKRREMLPRKNRHSLTQAKESNDVSHLQGVRTMIEYPAALFLNLNDLTNLSGMKATLLSVIRKFSVCLLVQVLHNSTVLCDNCAEFGDAWMSLYAFSI